LLRDPQPRGTVVIGLRVVGHPLRFADVSFVFVF
jgi:hypothetical protein